MLDPSSIFGLASNLAMLGWLALLVALFVKPARTYAWPAAQFVIPAILAIGYVLLIWQGRSGFEQGGFSSVEAVRTLFANDAALTAGWLHYLAFDLFIGAWISRDAASRGISPLIVLPCLPLTFLLGPAGPLLYLAARAVLANKETVQ
ncbi:ABA4-like family protein [Sphingomonas sp. BT-65]|uniref:ABA4-like family protein n=1 Tax=Sphingomonas sp. BT-65 TaxID=2989821 RepID=UPI002235BB94|nr:ABA4-like family protein [Sphingomonas sp. BT-65]MCW4463386.1 ABA4-like family protein [Sphingomonas sp. BT-65]